MDINKTQVFEANKPFRLPKARYMVVSRSNFSVLVNNGIDLYHEIYQPANYSQSAYGTVPADTIILTLLDPSGNHVYIPENEVLISDSTSQVDYNSKALVINLGTHQKDRSFTLLQERVKEVILDMEGIDVGTSVHDVSTIDSITVDKHQSILQRREKVMLGNKNYVVRLKEAQDTILIHKAQLSAMVEFIKDYLIDCCNTNTCWSFAGQNIERVLLYEFSIDQYVNTVMKNDNLFIGSPNVLVDYSRRWRPAEVS